MVDMFFYRDPEETEKETEAAAPEKTFAPEYGAEWGASADAATAQNLEWEATGSGVAGVAALASAAQVDGEWGNETAGEWGNEPAAPATATGWE